MKRNKIVDQWERPGLNIGLLLIIPEKAICFAICLDEPK